MKQSQYDQYPQYAVTILCVCCLLNMQLCSSLVLAIICFERKVYIYHSFIQYTGSYMFRQQSAIIRELLGSAWVTSNADQVGGILYNVWLRGLCAGVLWFRLLCFLAQLGSTTLRHTGHLNIHYMIPSIRSVFQVTNSDEPKKLPDGGRPLPKHVGACILNKGLVQFSTYAGCFWYV
jgi:hypothetical protein